MSIKYQKLKLLLGMSGVMCVEDRIQIISSLSNLSHNLPHISATYITPRTPNNNFCLLMFYIFIY